MHAGVGEKHAEAVCFVEEFFVGDFTVFILVHLVVNTVQIVLTEGIDSHELFDPTFKFFLAQLTISICIKLLENITHGV